jgi:hypothetical protein
MSPSSLNTVFSIYGDGSVHLNLLYTTTLDSYLLNTSLSTDIQTVSNFISVYPVIQCKNSVVFKDDLEENIITYEFSKHKKSKNHENIYKNRANE